MIEELATVIAVEQEQVTVESKVKSGCSQCQQVDTCGNGQVAKAIPQKKMRLVLTTKLAVNVGDTLVLGVPNSQLLAVAWQVYLWPLFGLIFFAALGQWLLVNGFIEGELYVVILASLGGYLGFRCAKFWQNVHHRAKSILPVILRIENKSTI